ncbi:MAG: ChrR family anti-sigma-E factor [Pseudomonadota bacterium]
MTASMSIDELIAGHAAGRLPEPVAMVIATHLALSPESRRLYDGYNEVGGVLLDGIEPIPVSDKCFEQTIAALDWDQSDADVANYGPCQSGRWPSPLSDYLSDTTDEKRWRHYGSASELDIETSSTDFRVRLIRVKAGRAVPRHTHRGLELTLVLEGAYRDEFGRFACGDIAIADGDIDHQPVAEAGRDCFCLAVTDAPLRLTGRFGRFLNPFIEV